MTDRNERCETCLYFVPWEKPHPQGGTFGACVNEVLQTKYTDFGITSSLRWCGEWKEKDEAT